MIQSMDGQLQDISSRRIDAESAVRGTGSEVHDIPDIFTQFTHDNILDWLHHQGLEDRSIGRLRKVFFGEGIDDLSRLLKAVRRYSSTPGGFRSWIMSKGAKELDIDDLDISEAALEQELAARQTITGIIHGCSYSDIGQVLNGQPHGSGTRTFTSGVKAEMFMLGSLRWVSMKGWGSMPGPMEWSISGNGGRT